MERGRQIRTDSCLWTESMAIFTGQSDVRDFNSLGISIDDLIESYISTVLSVIAIDKMACRLVDEKGRFEMELFSALNPDSVLCGEILM